MESGTKQEPRYESRRSEGMQQENRLQVEQLIPEDEAYLEPTALRSALLETAKVLEAVESDQTFRNTPVSVLCPGCGEVKRRYPEGLPERLAHFDEWCSTCETSLRRWSAVAISTAFEEFPNPTALESVIKSYWDTHLWDGIVSGEHNARTAEYTRAYKAQAKAFNWTWDVTCPLCRQSITELGIGRLDYHHWQHDPDQGICLCRSCHEAVSGGGCDHEQDWRAQQLGLKDKHDLQITRLAFREQAMAYHETISELAETLYSRYNLIQSPVEVTHLLQQTLQSEVIIENVVDEYLTAGLPIDSIP